MTDEELKSKEYLRKRSLEKLARMRPMDDTLMRSMFKDNIELAQGVLRIILNKPDLVIESLKTQDETDLGRLMHDFNCKNASDMHFSFMADSTRCLKETQKGVESMCDIMEEFIREERAEAELRNSIKVAKKLYAKGTPVEIIAESVEYPIETVKEWLGIAA